MRHGDEVAQEALDALLKAGADKASCGVSTSVVTELNVERAQIGLLRSTMNVNVNLMAIKDQKKGSVSLNSLEPSAIDRAATDTLAMAAVSQPDPAFDIAEAQEPASFESGAKEPDHDAMYDRMKEFLDTVADKYPTIMLRQAYLSFSRHNWSFVNSNGVDYRTEQGVYRFNALFSAREGDEVSSFNYTGFSMRDLEQELLERGSLDIMLRQTTEQVRTRPVKGKFMGDMIIAPDCLGSFLGFLTHPLSDRPLISGTSLYKDSLGEKIAGAEFTLHSRPVSSEIADGYFVTGDGYAAENSTIIDRGVLKSYLLSLYGAKKTGRERAKNNGGAYVVEPGTTPLEEAIRGVKQGVLLVRFSGGSPSANGDFSGVAKNSYYIEDGQIAYPIRETMVSGNFAEAFRNLKVVSKERVDFGWSILPWVVVPGITISGR
ncbi:MAG: TldD/PmbA family protein [Firmicutes bacterium]|jgi:PmbA protein|nr:TldD/PmbA family protein [Bacillota bacterium]